MPEPDELYQSMNKWQVSCALQLMHEYGHSWDVAMGLASMSRWEIEIGLRRSQSLIIVTGI
jgi:hypothetical protein